MVGSDGSGGLYRSSVTAPAGSPKKVLETAHKVSVARHPHTGERYIFFAQGSRLVDGFSLFTAPVDPKTGDLKGTPVKIIPALATIASVPRLLNFDTADNGMIIWRRTSASIPVWRIHWFDRNGNILSNVGDAGTYTALTLSPDEMRVAAEQSYPGSEIWVCDLRRGTGSRLSTEPGWKNYPLWSGDGRSLYYENQTEEGYSIVRRDADGGGQAEVLYEGGQPDLPHSRTRRRTADTCFCGKYALKRMVSTGWT